MMQPKSKRNSWLVIVLLLLAAIQIGNVWRVLTLPAEIAAQSSLIQPLEVAAGLTWAVAMTVAAWRIGRHSMTFRYGVVLLSAFVVYSTLRTFLFARADYDRLRLPFWVALAVISILIAVVVYRRTGNTAQKEEFQKDGYEPEDRFTP